MAKANLKAKMDKNQTYADYLMSRGKEYENKRKERAAERQAHKEEEAECSFTPKIIDLPDAAEEKLSPEAKKAAKHNKWEQLYNAAERKAMKNKSNKTTEQIEWEKNQQECKFAPEIHDINITGSKKAKVKPTPVRISRRN